LSADLYRKNDIDDEQKTYLDIQSVDLYFEKLTGIDRISFLQINDEWKAEGKRQKI